MTLEEGKWVWKGLNCDLWFFTWSQPRTGGKGQGEKLGIWSQSPWDQESSLLITDFVPLDKLIHKTYFVFFIWTNMGENNIYLCRVVLRIKWVYSGHVWMWELDCEESWAPKNWCFWTVVLEKTLESPLDCKEIQPVHSKGDPSWVFFGRTDVKAETPILWPPHAKSWLIGKDPDAGRD